MAKRKSGFGSNHQLLLIIANLSVFCISLSEGQQYPQQYYQQTQPNVAQYGSVQSQYPAQYQPQVQQAVQSAPLEDHREVDEKDYSVSGGSSWLWYLGMPVIFIPLILLLCTPLFHKPYDSPYSYYGGEHGGHHGGSGWGWGNHGHKDGWKRSSDDKVKEDVTTRVLKGISNTASNNSKKIKIKATKSETSGADEQRG